MIRHLFRLVWNRKKTHALIMLEILLSFVVVFALLAATAHYVELYNQPTGYDTDDVWTVFVDRESGTYPWTAEEASQFRRLRRELETMPEILEVASGNNFPFSNSSSVSGWDQGDMDAEAETIHASVTYADVFGMTLKSGRWFDESDAALEWKPAVIDQQLSRELFGDADPLGKIVELGADVQEVRVVGLIEAFRRGGNFVEPRATIILSAEEHSDEGVTTSNLLLKMSPNVAPVFEQTMVERLQTLAPGWSFGVRPIADARKQKLQQKLVPLAIFGVVGVFLLIMVILGLTGVMWQNVTRRTREIGLRRASGASRGMIHRQIVLEVMIIAVFGVAIGAAIAMQVPFVGPFSFLPVSTAVKAVLGASVSILILAALCGLYPGVSATRIQPSEALHYE